MDAKKCFTCKVDKPLTEFTINRRKYSLKSDKGRNIVCIDCCEKKALEQLSCVQFNFTTNQFDIIHFENEEQAKEYYITLRKNNTE
jgi:hypothetical protein